MQHDVAVLVIVHDVGGGVDLDPRGRQGPGQPTPALEIGADLLDAGLDRNVEGGPGLGPHLAGGLQQMAGLEAGDGLGEAVVIDALRRSLGGRGVLGGEPGLQRLDNLAPGALAQGPVRRQGLPAAARSDLAIGRQRLDEGLVARIGRRQGLQPVLDAVGPLRGHEVEVGVVGGRPDAPLLGEPVGGKAEAMLRAGVLQHRGAQQMLALGRLAGVG